MHVGFEDKEMAGVDLFYSCMQLARRRDTLLLFFPFILPFLIPYKTTGKRANPCLVKGKDELSDGRPNKPMVHQLNIEQSWSKLALWKDGMKTWNAYGCPKQKWATMLMTTFTPHLLLDFSQGPLVFAVFRCLVSGVCWLDREPHIALNFLVRVVRLSWPNVSTMISWKWYHPYMRYPSHIFKWLQRERRRRRAWMVIVFFLASWSNFITRPHDDSMPRKKQQKVDCTFLKSGDYEDHNLITTSQHL